MKLSQLVLSVHLQTWETDSHFTKIQIIKKLNYSIITPFNSNWETVLFNSVLKDNLNKNELKLIK